MSWKDEAAGHEREKIPCGFHLVTAVKCMRERKDGSEFRTDKGPFLMVVYRNDEEQECAVNYFLTPKARWKLARDLSRLGISMDELDERGVEIDAFLDVKFAQNEIEGRTSWAQVSPGRGKYPDVELITPDKVPAELRETPSEPEQDKPEQDESGAAPDTDDASTETDEDKLPF